MAKQASIEILCNKWANELSNETIDMDYLYNCFRKIYAASVSSSIRNFQFRLIHRIIATNSQLHKWGIKENGLCSFCNVVEENYVHMFCQCECVKTFWKDVFKWSKKALGTVINFSNSEIILGTPEKIEPLFDLVLIVGKKHINYCKYKNLTPNIDGFRKQIEDVRAVEKYIAVKNKKLHVFHKKWFIMESNPNNSNESIS